MAAAPRSPECPVERLISCPLSHKMYDDEGLLCCACGDLQWYLDLTDTHLEQLCTWGCCSQDPWGDMAKEMVNSSPVKLPDVVVIKETQELPKCSCSESSAPVNKNECVITVNEFPHGKEMLLADDQEEGDNDEELEDGKNSNKDKFTPWEY